MAPEKSRGARPKYFEVWFNVTFLFRFFVSYSGFIMPYCFVFFLLVLFFFLQLYVHFMFFKSSFISMFNQTLVVCVVLSLCKNTLSVVSLNTPNVIQVGSFQLDECFKHCTLDSNDSNKDIEVFHIVKFPSVTPTLHYRLHCNPWLSFKRTDQGLNHCQVLCCVQVLLGIL